MAKRGPPELEVMACTHRKSDQDPHLQCRRCRTCTFFTDECDVCKGMSAGRKARVELTWEKSDARQRQRARSLDRQGTSSDYGASSHSSSQRESNSEASLSVRLRHRREFTSKPTTPAKDSGPASKMAAMAAENLALRARITSLETAVPAATPLPPLQLFESPVRVERFRGFDPDVLVTAPLRPAPISSLFPTVSSVAGDRPSHSAPDLTAPAGVSTNGIIKVTSNDMITYGDSMAHEDGATRSVSATHGVLTTVGDKATHSVSATRSVSATHSVSATAGDMATSGVSATAGDEAARSVSATVGDKTTNCTASTGGFLATDVGDVDRLPPSSFVDTGITPRRRPTVPGVRGLQSSRGNNESAGDLEDAVRHDDGTTSDKASGHHRGSRMSSRRDMSGLTQQDRSPRRDLRCGDNEYVWDFAKTEERETRRRRDALRHFDLTGSPGRHDSHRSRSPLHRTERHVWIPDRRHRDPSRSPPRRGFSPPHRDRRHRSEFFWEPRRSRHWTPPPQRGPRDLLPVPSPRPTLPDARDPDAPRAVDAVAPQLDQFHFDGLLGPTGEGGGPTGDPIGDEAEAPEWLTPPEFYRMILDTLPEGYRQNAPPPRVVAPGPDLDVRPGNNAAARPERVYLPPSSGLLRSLYLAYGAFYPVDNISVIPDLLTNAPRYVHAAPLPAEPLDSMGNHFFRVSAHDKSSAESSQFRFADWNNVLPSVPVIDPNTRFGKVPSLNLQSGFVDTLQAFLRAGQRALSYGDLCVQAASEIFRRLRALPPDDPQRPILERDLEMCHAQAITCNKATFVSVTRADCNVSLAKRDAYLQTFPVPSSIRKKLRAQPFHGSPYLFAGNVRAVYPPLMDDVAPTVQVTCAIPPVAPGVRPPTTGARPRAPRSRSTASATATSTSQQRTAPQPARQPAAQAQRTSPRFRKPAPPQSAKQPFRGGRGGGRKK